MTEYLEHRFDPDDPELISIIDELPLWSAPFGLDLLETVRLRPGISLLDVGCGLGFPLIELAQRIGDAGKAVGIDPWNAGLERTRLKIRKYNLTNVDVVEGVAENLPFDAGTFDLIVSNNGINNVQDVDRALSECHRVGKPDAQFVMTYNLDGSMREFYDLFEATLVGNGLHEQADRMRSHIHKKRKPLQEMKSSLTSAGFRIVSVAEKRFHLRFADSRALFNHSLIKYWFLGAWKEVVGSADIGKLFEELERRIDASAAERGEFVLSIPYVTIDARA